MLLVSPESTETASLYYSDKDYVELGQLLDAPGTGTRDKPPEADLTAARQVNVTWMIHDVTPWRLDQVFPLDDGRDVWIHTAANLDRTRNGTWHRADHPTQLRALLKGLGLMGKASADTAANAAEATEVTEASPARATRSGGATDWWWALPGAAAGAVLALFLRPYVARLPLDRLRRGEPGPRQELRDV
ncbi:hypothetical protein GCM10022233_50130 [Streptomyces shaanxiensis]|uniref:Uncharacterized protein n=1 Tax=Streptomyces shaanxiensis TaxID=653357 RepID=A0ABP7VJ29_9ACTN